MKIADLKLILTARCQEASELASAALDRDLTRCERWALRLHTFVCRPCRRLVRQLRMMRELMQSVPASHQAISDEVIARLSPERRRQIKEMLAKSGSAD